MPIRDHGRASRAGPLLAQFGFLIFQWGEYGRLTSKDLPAPAVLALVLLLGLLAGLVMRRRCRESERIARYFHEIQNAGRTVRAEIWRGPILFAAALLALYSVRAATGWPTYIGTETEKVWKILPDSCANWSRLIFEGDAKSQAILLGINVGLSCLAGLIVGGLLKVVTLSPRVRFLFTPLLLAACLACFLSATVHRPYPGDRYVEKGDWRTWSGDILSLRIPSDWDVRGGGRFRGVILMPSAGASAGGACTVVDERKQAVFPIYWTEGGSPFIPCMCAPLDWFEYARTDGQKVWLLRDCFSVKMANDRYRIDVHLRYGGHDEAMVQHVAESIRLKNSPPTPPSARSSSPLR